MPPVLKAIKVTFTPEGVVEYSIHYLHDHEPPTPGSKRRSAAAARMAHKALEIALELSKGPPVWAGFATNTRESEDKIIADRADREENAA